MAFWNRKRKERDQSEKPLQEKMVEISKQPGFSQKMEEQFKRRNSIFDGQRPDEDDYGYSMNNPICTSTIGDNAKYLSRLYTESGEKLYWIRVGSICLKQCNEVDNVIVDRYNLYLDGSKYAEIFICPYAHNCSHTPKGMVLAKEDEAIVCSGNLKQEAQDSGMSTEVFLQFLQLRYKDKKMKEKQKEDARKELEIQAVQVSKYYAHFNLDIALKNKTFVALLNCGIEMKAAYEYIQRDKLFYPCPSRTAVVQQLTPDEYYKIMYEFEDSVREHFVMPSSNSDIEKAAIEFGMSVPQTIQFYRLTVEENENRWNQLQKCMKVWADDAVLLHQKYPDFNLKREYENELFRKILTHTTLMTAYEVIHFQEIYRPIEEVKDDMSGSNISIDTYFNIFANIYQRASSALSSQALAHNSEFELLPAMLVIADYSCLSANKNRQRIVNGLINYISEKCGFDDTSEKLFDERIDFYGSIIRGKPLRAEWLQGQLEVIQDADAIVRCATALGDILINPECANDYDNAPILLYSIFAITDFAEMYIKEIIPLFVELFKQIYDA